MLTSENVKEKL